MKKREIPLVAAFFMLLLILLPQPNQAAFAFPEISYDDETVEVYYTPASNDIIAVRFSPPADTFKLSGMRLYLNVSNKKNVRVWVWDSSRTNFLMTPHNTTISFSGGPWYSVDFGEFGPIFTPANVSDFYIVLQWIYSGAPNIGVDKSSTSGRSWYNASGTLQQYSGNIMLRAQVEDINPPSFDHIPMRFAIAGEDLTLSMEVIDEFGVTAVTLYYRENGSSGAFGAISLTLTGDPKNGIWYGTILGINVTLNGLEYYIWATDIGGNSRYYGNSTTPYVVTVLVQAFEMPLLLSIISIVVISAAAVMLYIVLPPYKGVDTK